MLRHLHIRNLAIIEDIALDFQHGMTVLTGETGAGKSIVLDGLSLLAGVRAAPSLVRSGADRAVAEAVFEVEPNGPLAGMLAERGVEGDEPGEIILRREVMASGRGRASVNGRLVPVSQLAEVAGRLLEITGQHEQQRLLDPAAQREFVDEFAGLHEQREAYSDLYVLLLEARRRVEDLSREDREREQRRDFLRFQVEELEGLGLQTGEVAGLERERQRLGHLEELAQRTGLALEHLEGEDAGESAGACALAGKAGASLEEAARHDDALAPIAEALREAEARLSEACRDLQHYVNGLEADPGRLEEINQRWDALRRALRKHGPGEDDLLRNLEAMREELDRLENCDARREEAEREYARLCKAVLEKGKELSVRRTRAGESLRRPLEALLRDFSMPKARVEVALRPLAAGIPLGEDSLAGPSGLEEVELLFSANAGEEVRPLRKVASGGEMSRLMLALRTLNAERDAVPLLVFDEVDAGISGAAARRVAERLAALGERHQVLCVTHNPSIAALADHHFVVDKQEHRGRTRTSVVQVDRNERKEELARLLDGGQRSRKGLELAAELLKKAG